MTGDTAIRRLTAAAVLLVAAIAAVVSYVHIAELALSHGQGRLAAYLLPVSIDGAVVVASLALLRAARVGLATPRPAQALLAAAIAATLAANLAAGAPYGPVGMAVSGWPAAAFLGCCEIAVAMVRKVHRAAPRAVPEAHPRTRPARTRGTAPTVDQAEVEFATELATGTVPSIRQVRTRLHVGQDRAREIKAHLEHVAGNGVRP